jgi:hypothetical protein
MRMASVGGLVWFLLAAAVAPARAQQTTPSPAPPIQIPADELDFLGRSSVILGSGARAYGMGGAFLARADDATAASWNPAGLSYLRRPEISVVGARNEQSITSSSPGNLDEFLGYTPDFAAAAYPIHLRSARGAVQLSFQRVFSFQGERELFRQAQRDTQGGALLDRSFVSRGSGGFDVLAFGSGLQVTRSLRVGFTVNRWINGYVQHRDRSLLRDDAVTGVPTTVDRSLQLLDFGVSGWNANLGLIWTPVSQLNLGLVAKTPFDGSVTMTRERTDTASIPLGTVTKNQATKDDVRLHIPAAAGVGASWRLRSPLTLSLDYTQTFWSKGRIENFFVLNKTPDPSLPDPDITKPGNTVDAAGNTELLYPTLDDPVQEDTGQLRMGVEYVVIAGHVRVPLRAGYFTDKQYFRDATNTAPRYHGWTVGTGIIAGPILFDVAFLRESGSFAEASDTVHTRFQRFFVSMIYRYGATR